MLFLSVVVARSGVLYARCSVEISFSLPVETSFNRDLPRISIPRLRQHSLFLGHTGPAAETAIRLCPN